jgi:hypothetical protein
VRAYLEKPFTKTGLVGWLKLKALSLSPRTEKKKRRRDIYSNIQTNYNLGTQEKSIAKRLPLKCVTLK